MTTAFRIRRGLFIGNGRYRDPRRQRMDEIEALRGEAISGRIGPHNCHRVTVETDGA
ncbi:MAG: hypothetical protein ACFCUJ_07250 [Thiotrichales bacterium]